MSEEKNVNMDELAKAFEGDKPRKKPAKKAPIIVLVLGILALIGGAVFLIIRLTAGPSVADAEYLISEKEWVREDEPNVIWSFTEAGKGKLTTDNHLNDYDFAWTIEDKKLKIKTSWLYDLNDDFEYTLDQGTKTLTLKTGDKEIKFKVAL